MTKSLAIIAAVVASTTFGGAALAAGDYYQGADKNVSESHVDARHTGSIGGTGYARFEQTSRGNHTFDNSLGTVNRGDYYQGATRPN